MELLVTFSTLAGGLALLYFGAEGLVRGGTALALRFGVSPLVIGLTVVAFGTSSPELVVSVQAALNGNGAIAVGNVVGSNICNIALILGLSALIRPLRVHAHLLRLDVPVMIVVSMLLLLLLLDGRISRAEGFFLLAGIIGYTGYNIWQARREAPRIQEEFAQALPTPLNKAWLDVLYVLGGLGLLMAGADLLVDGATVIARTFGMSDAMIGLTIVAIGTSLPELATSVVAAARGEGDIAIGNVIGSNVFNILGILGVSSLVRPLQNEGINLVDLGVMTAVAVLMLPLMRTGFRLMRGEGALLLALYIGYVFYLISLNQPALPGS